MESLRVKDLQEIAKSKGLKGWYRLRKSDLISFITSEENRERECENVESQIDKCRRERLEKATAEANAKAEKRAISKARRQAKRDEAKWEVERRATSGT